MKSQEKCMKQWQENVYEKQGHTVSTVPIDEDILKGTTDSVFDLEKFFDGLPVIIYDTFTTSTCSNDFVDETENKLDIGDLRKRIKYAKTPMERRSLEQQLNDVYKKRKSNRRKIK